MYTMYLNSISGVMVSLFSLNAVVDSGCKLWSFQTKDYKIGKNCYFSAKHTALMIKDWFGSEENHRPSTSHWQTLSH